jgi:hypothetical protein
VGYNFGKVCGGYDFAGGNFFRFSTGRCIPGSLCGYVYFSKDCHLGGFPAGRFGDDTAGRWPSGFAGFRLSAEDLSFFKGPREKVWADAIDEECEGDLDSPSSALAADASASQCPAPAWAAPFSTSPTTTSRVAVTPSAREGALAILKLHRGDPESLRQTVADIIPDSARVDLIMKEFENMWAGGDGGSGQSSTRK